MDIKITPQSLEEEKQIHTAGVVPLAQSGESPAQNPETKITIILPSNAYFMSGIRDFTLQMVMNMTGFSEQWAFRFQSVVDELCNNAIEHGSAPEKEIRATFISKKGGYIEIQVEDTQTGKMKRTAQEMYNILEEKKNTDHTLSGSIRGRGLSEIVSAWTDELKFEDLPNGGIRVTARKSLAQ